MSDKIKTLSQAIRLGATFRPRCKGKMFKAGGSCALGAAYEAVTGVGTERAYENPMYPEAEDFLSRRFDVPLNIITRIELMNDALGMTREAIADWLENKGY